MNGTANVSWVSRIRPGPDYLPLFKNLKATTVVDSWTRRTPESGEAGDGLSLNEGGELGQWREWHGPSRKDGA